jgi:hypothetical protein
MQIVTVHSLFQVCEKQLSISKPMSSNSMDTKAYGQNTACAQVQNSVKHSPANASVLVEESHVSSAVKVKVI